jgi:hypothetical protein
MISYETVSEATNSLMARGYTIDFNIKNNEDCITCKKNSISLSPEEFEIDEVYRFEGMTDPGDEMIVFALSGKTVPVKGILVNAYGIYADDQSSKIVRYLSRHL